MLGFHSTQYYTHSIRIIRCAYLRLSPCIPCKGHWSRWACCPPRSIPLHSMHGKSSSPLASILSSHFMLDTDPFIPTSFLIVWSLAWPHVQSIVRNLWLRTIQDLSFLVFCRHSSYIILSASCLGKVHAGYRIKPHAPPLGNVPAYSFKFQSCDRTPRAEIFRVSLNTFSPFGSLHILISSFTVWTTEVPNLIRYPHFRHSMSVGFLIVAFASGLPQVLIRFYPSYLRSTIFLPL